MSQQFIYQSIAQTLEHQIKRQVFKIGDKLPSVREICREQGVSMNTALNAYYQLESKGLIASRPQSGYYVVYSHHKFPEIPEISQPVQDEGADKTEQLIADVFSVLGTETNVNFSLGVPDPKLLPIAKINKSLTRAIREMPHNGIMYDSIQGNQKLRNQIAKGSISWEGTLTEDDLITTPGCMGALSYSLMSITKKGDVLLTESPVYFGVLQLAQSLGLQVVELPTHPDTGIDIDILEETLKKQKVAVCLLVSNFNNPTGSCMPDSHKEAVVRLLENHHVPLIEDDLYGDVYFGNKRPKSCKSFDKSGNVLWCGSVSKTLVPGYRVGWIAPGRFKEKIISTKLYQSVSSTSIVQEAVGNFLETGRYENHLRKLRHTLHANSIQYLKAIGNYFPEGTKVSRPTGGFLIWIQLDPKLDTAILFQQALKYKISIAPGRMFTLQNQYSNCIRLSYGMTWDERIDKSLKVLGMLAKQMILGFQTNTIK
ncbi:PLP-dependent aminotransferase family protein [Algoriphagus sp. Y33]|uniref:aminotransferase-like domain-containing protein n=1 Tax=Algoriphagus sp. Y33 TaxID=2772483 RepID=UPI00177D7886|nr:PLP-dependent aminotransferase family protein [Algoriphagus sp. Y33]